MKIGKKLAIMIMGFNIVGSVILVGSVLSIAQEKISKIITKDVVNLAQVNALEIQVWLNKYMSAARTAAQLMEHYEEVDVSQRRHIYNMFVKNIVEANPEIAAAGSCWEPGALDGMDAGYVDTPGSDYTGRFIPYWSRGNVGVSLSAIENYEKPGEGDFYLLSKQTGNETIIEPYWYMINGKKQMITTLTVPIKPGGRFVGAFMVDIEVSMMQDKVQKIRPYEGSVAAVYSNSGVVVGHYDPERIGKLMADTEKDVAGSFLPELQEAIRNGKPYTFRYMSNKNGEMDFFIVPFTVGNTVTPWSLLVGIPVKIINMPTYRMLTVSAIICAVMLVIIAVGALIMARSISAPLNVVVKELECIGTGDLTKHLDIKRKDEIGTMTSSLNSTVDSIRELIFTIKQKSASLSAIGSELSANMTDTAAAINEITSNIKSIKSQAAKQSAGVNDSAIAMDKIIVNINKLNSEIDKQSASVSQSSSAVEQMLANIQSVTQTLIKNSDNVRELTEASELGRAGLRQVSADIREIARESEGLLEINGVMENIASQTNLLSMNAAIEAAHAGEAGKGFAVVADEIRKLAESSGEQSQTISTVLKKITDSINLITRSTDEVLNKFEAIDSGVKTVSLQEENIRKAMEEQSAGSQQILEAISKLNDISSQVKVDSEEMLSGSSEVMETSKTLEAITEELSNGMKEMDIGADQINVAVNSVNEISVGNKHDIEALITEVDKFKVE
jgi:methyl-accepting chemotaxis protein